MGSSSCLPPVTLPLTTRTTRTWRGGGSGVPRPGADLAALAGRGAATHFEGGQLLQEVERSLGTDDDSSGASADTGAAPPALPVPAPVVVRTIGDMSTAARCGGDGCAAPSSPSPSASSSSSSSSSSSAAAVAVRGVGASTELPLNESGGGRRVPSRRREADEGEYLHGRKLPQCRWLASRLLAMSPRCAGSKRRRGGGGGEEVGRGDARGAWCASTTSPKDAEGDGEERTTTATAASSATTIPTTTRWHTSARVGPGRRPWSSRASSWRPSRGGRR